MLAALSPSTNSLHSWAKPPVGSTVAEMQWRMMAVDLSDMVFKVELTVADLRSQGGSRQRIVQGLKDPPTLPRP